MEDLFQVNMDEELMKTETGHVHQPQLTTNNINSTNEGIIAALTGQDVMWSESMIPDIIKKPISRASHSHYDPAMTEAKWEKINNVQTKMAKSVEFTSKRRKRSIESEFKTYVSQLPPYDLLKIIGQDRESQVALLTNVIRTMFPHLYRTMLDICRSSLNHSIISARKISEKSRVLKTRASSCTDDDKHIMPYACRGMEESDCFIADPETCWQEGDERDFWASIGEMPGDLEDSTDDERQPGDLAPTSIIVDFMSSVSCPLTSVSATKLDEG